MKTARDARKGSNGAGRCGRALGAFLALGGVASLGPAPVVGQDVSVTGQVRSRFERTDPASAAGGAEAFVSMRVRAAIEARLAGRTRLFVQFQDVRLWGEETSTLGDFSADALDLHQGWVEIGLRDRHALRVGRQEIAFGGERLVGAVGWTQQGRSFDGARATLRGSSVRVDLVGLQIRDESNRGGPPLDGDVGLFGAYAVLQDLPGGTLDLFGLFDTDQAMVETRQFTGGGRLVGSHDRVSYRVEAALQSGERMGEDVSAWMFGARAGTAIGSRGRLTLWFDHLSGDGDPDDGEVGAFSTLYATNHKFYGFADLFLNIPAHTAGLGLQDIALKGSINAGDDVTLGADLHFFRFAEEAVDGTRDLGTELDVTGTWSFTPGVRLSGGIAQVFAGDGLELIGRLTEDRTFLYLMLDAVF